MEILERGPHLVELQRLLDELPAGQGRLVFLGGEAGVGKTTLIAALCQGIRPPFRILRGSCDPLSTPRPLGPLVDMADDLGGDVARLLDAQDSRDRIFHAVLDNLTGQPPALVIVEDVHWADDATLDLLRYLGRRIGGTAALVVVTYRDDEVGARHPLRVVLGDLATAPAIRRMSVSPLSEDAVRRLATGSAIDPVALHRQTGGNPFFVTEVLATGTTGVPPTVRDAVLARATRLSEAGRNVLDAAAVIGAVIEIPLLGAVIGADTGAIEECVASGVLRMTPEGYAFRHEIAREAIVSALDPVRRVALHRTVLDALQSGVAGDASLARLAHHADEAGDRAAVLEYAPGAARQAAGLHAHLQAAAQYERALRVAGDLEPSDRAQLLEEYAAECAVIDHLDEAIDAYRQAARLRRATGDRLREGAILSELGQLLVMAGQNADGERTSLEAISLLETLPASPQLARSYHLQAHLRMLDRDNDEAVEIGWRAIALAKDLGIERIVISALNTVGSAMLVSGDDRGIDHLEESVQRARAAGHDPMVASALGNLGSGCGEMYQLERADRYLTEAVAYCQERDMDFNRLYALSWLAQVRLFQGWWTEASEIAAQVMQRPRAAIISRTMALIALGRIRARRGDPEVCAVLDEAAALARQTGTLQRLAPVHAALAEAAWLAGDVAQTAAQARAVYVLALEHRHPWHTGELAWWLRLAGGDVHPPGWTAEPWRLQLAGDWRGAAAAWAERGCPYEQARALADGDELALKEALAIFDNLGAAPMAGSVTRRLRELGVRGVRRGPRPSTRSNPAGLTQRELEVLRDLAAGLRNAEIAERLYLSTKTVERHVSAIFTKLDVSTRTEAARRASDLGVLGE